MQNATATAALTLCAPSRVELASPPITCGIMRALRAGISGVHASAHHTDPDLLNAELVAWAIAYAANGIPVFPLRTKTQPLVAWGTEASTDIQQISEWWRRWPHAMIGAPTGERGGFVVLDIDRKNGVDGFAVLEERGLQIPPDAPCVITPSGGAHFYFDYWNAGLRNSAGKVGPGIDVRADGGMAILPPSRPVIESPGYRFSVSRV